MAVLILIAAFAGPDCLAAGLERTAFLPYGSGPGQVGLTEAPDGRHGPQDFAVDAAGSIWVLDTENNRAFPVDEPEISKAVPPGTVLFAFNGPEISTMNSVGIIELSGVSGDPVPFTSSNPFPTAFEFSNGLARVWSGGRAVPVRSGDATAVVERAGLGFVEVAGEDGSRTAIYSIQLPGLAEITPLGVTGGGLLAAEAQAAESTNDGLIRRFAILVSRSGTLVSKLEIPPVKYASMRRDVRMAGDGSILVMLSTSGGVEIWRWNGEDGLSFPVDYISAQVRPEDGFEYKTFTPGPGIAPPPAAIKRSEALAIAKTYNDHAWTAAAANITTTTCTDWCGKTKSIVPPSWVLEGENHRFPYCWGGYSSVSGFDQGLVASTPKKAGDKQTKYGDGTSACGSSCAVGVDCSGFVSRCWTAGQHYGTSQMGEIATAISKSDLKPADALNDPSSHIRLLVALRTDGNWDMVESYAGSGYWGVGYTVRSPADNSGYDAIRYKLIQDDPPVPHDPPTIAHTPLVSAEAGHDIVIGATATTSTGKVSAFNLRYRKQGDTGWTIVAFSDKGSGNWEALIPASAVTLGALEYYLAIWDGEEPPQDGRNRVVLPADAETSSHYFSISIAAADGGFTDVGLADAGSQDVETPDADIDGGDDSDGVDSSCMPDSGPDTGTLPGKDSGIDSGHDAAADAGLSADTGSDSGAGESANNPPGCSCATVGIE
jgi:hypothetical protein